MGMGHGSRYSRPGDAQTDDGFLGANAPWFGYDRAATRQPDVTVPLFSGTIHQSSNRLITAEVPRALWTDEWATIGGH